MSPDPGNAGADLLNPQSWNMYAYVGGDPMNATDPTGMDSVTDPPPPVWVPCPGCTVTVPSGPIDPITGFPAYYPNCEDGSAQCWGGSQWKQLPSSMGSGTTPASSSAQPQGSVPPIKSGTGNCVAGYTAGGAAVGATAGYWAGGGAGALGGGAAGTAIEPGGGTAVGAFGGFQVGSEGGATGGFALGARAGYLLDNIVCNSSTGSGGSGEGRVTFGHGARHLAGSSLSQSQIEAAIKAQVQEIAQTSSSTGNSWGKVVVNGQQIFYRAFTLPDGTINIGTYTVGAP